MLQSLARDVFFSVLEWDCYITLVKDNPTDDLKLSGKLWLCSMGARITRPSHRPTLLSLYASYRLTIRISI